MPRALVVGAAVQVLGPLVAAAPAGLVELAAVLAAVAQGEELALLVEGRVSREARTLRRIGA